MPALSTSMIPDSASKAAARTNAPDAGNSGDASAFAILLAAASQQVAPQNPQDNIAPPANDGDMPQATPDAQNNAAMMGPPAFLNAPGLLADQAVSAGDGKKDKNAGDKDPDDDVAAGPVQPPAPIALANDPSIVQIIQQKPGAIPGGAGPNAADGTPPGIALVAENGIGWASQTNAGDRNDGGKTEDTHIATPPANDDSAAAAPIPSPVQTADDGAPIDLPATISSPVQDDAAVAQDKSGDGKPAAGKSVSDKPAATADIQPNQQSGDDAAAISQLVMTAPPAPANPAASNDNRTDAAATRIAKIAPPQAEKPDANIMEPANKPLQAPGSADAAPASANAPVPPAMADGKGDAKPADSVKTASGNDTKPAHIAAPDAAPQPDAPAPVQVQHAAPTPVPPQGPAAAAFDLPNPVAGAATATTSLHLANADADPTPNLDALAVSIAARSQSGVKQFEIRLDPPELGRVDVRLSIDASGKTQAHMTADQPQTLDLLQKDAPTLTQALRDAGLDVSQGGLNFSLRGQDRQNDDGGNGGAPGRRTNLTASRTIQAAQGPAAISFNGAAADARVDIHV